MPGHGRRNPLLQRIEQRAALQVDLLEQARPAQPALPVPPVIGRVQQRHPGQPLRIPHAIPQQPRRTDRDQSLIEQPAHLDLPTELPIAQQHRAVVGLAGKIHAVDVHPHACQLHGVGLGVTLDAAQQPAHGQGGGRLQAQVARSAAKRLAGLFDQGKAGPQLLGQAPPGIGEAQARAVALEQAATELGFQGADMAADGALGQRQLFPGAGERTGTRRHFKGAQCIQRGQTFNHARGSP